MEEVGHFYMLQGFWRLQYKNIYIYIYKAKARARPLAAESSGGAELQIVDNWQECPANLIHRTEEKLLFR